MPAGRRQAVEVRAGRRCEYCRAPQRVCGYRFHLEHVVPRTLGGPDEESNLALACSPCNLAKGARVQATDPSSGEWLPLFNPRAHAWGEHFTWTSGWHVHGRTPIGRATTQALDLNAPLRLESRVL